MQIIADEVAKSGSHHGSESSRPLTDIDYAPIGDPINQRPMDDYKASSEFQNYEKLCRGEETRVSSWIIVFFERQVWHERNCGKHNFICSTSNCLFGVRRSLFPEALLIIGKPFLQTVYSLNAEREIIKKSR